MLLLALDAMTSFSVVPLRFASHLGLTFGMLGLAMLGYTLLAWALGQVLQGWTSLAAIMLILGSVQLFVLGIFGEYLGRMYMESKRRPLYIVNRIVVNGTPDDLQDLRSRRERETTPVPAHHG
jgi:dolichol-phosphate mannosyltransferase